MKRIFLAAILVILSLPPWASQAAEPFQTPAGAVYLNPLPNALYVSTRTGLTARYSEEVEPSSVAGSLFQVVGQASGEHPGQARLAEDGETLIFTPAAPFVSGERVDVTLQDGLRGVGGGELKGFSYSFKTSETLETDSTSTLEAEFERSPLPARPEIERLVSAVPAYKTAPADLPHLGVLRQVDGAADGYLFLSNFRWNDFSANDSYLLIVDNQGEPVFYRAMGPGFQGFDFKKQPHGRLTYFNTQVGCFQVLDASYQVVDTVCAGNGYRADFHDLLLLPNGHALFMIYDRQTVDMSKVISGGKPNAAVTGLVIQELDSLKNVVFEWRSWDHFAFTDSSVDLTASNIDYVHGNAVEQDLDGNILLSSRHLDEITKINRQTGGIVWRLGGKKNQFTFLSNSPVFSHQHDIRRLANGNISLFDNRTDVIPIYSRAAEYQLNEGNKTIFQTWQYRSVPELYTQAMGNAQRLPNGNTLIGWGNAYPTLTEVKSDGSLAFELSLGSPQVSYRAFRFPWQGAPVSPPALAAETSGTDTILYVSWNGATQVSAYLIFAGSIPDHLSLLTRVEKTGFETKMALSDVQNRYCYFQALPLDEQGVPTRYSNVAFTGIPCTGRTQFFPLVANQVALP